MFNLIFTRVVKYCSPKTNFVCSSLTMKLMLRRKPSKEGLLVSIFAHTGIKLLWFQPHHLTNGYEAQFVRASKSMQDVTATNPRANKL